MSLEGVIFIFLKFSERIYVAARYFETAPLQKCLAYLPPLCFGGGRLPPAFLAHDDI